MDTTKLLLFLILFSLPSAILYARIHFTLEFSGRNNYIVKHERMAHVRHIVRVYNVLCIIVVIILEEKLPTS